MHRYRHLFPDAHQHFVDLLDAAHAARTDPPRTEPDTRVIELPKRQAQTACDLRECTGVTDGT
jgi:hypothetical protein